MEESLKSLVQLFKSDSKIKEILLKVAPPDFANQDDIIEYSDKLMQAIDDIAFEMDQIFSHSIFVIPTTMKETMKSNLKSIKLKVQQTLSPDELRKIYKDCFSDMSSDFVKDVGMVCVGYSMHVHFYKDGHNIGLSEVVANAKSINEMLHLLHSYICNNEAVFRSMPIVDKKSIGPYGNCTLFGSSNHIAKDIYDSMPTNSKDSEIGETYIIGLDNRVLMMVRDMGHALTIDIEEDKEKGTAFVKYFVPKICNPEKLNKLRGIHKVPITKDWLDMSASGMYETSIDGFGADMVNFIEQVPTDADITENHYFEKEDEVFLQKVTNEMQARNALHNPETEIRDFASMDIKESVTESDEKAVISLFSWLKEKTIWGKIKEK